MQRRIFWHEFLFVWGGAVAVTTVSFLLADFPPAALALQLFVPFHSQSTVVMLIAVIGQVGVQFAVATSVGLWAAHQVGLGAPILEGWLQNKHVERNLLPPLVPILVTAIVVAMFWTLPNLSIFHPNQKRMAAEVTEFSQSPAGAKVGDELGKLTARRPVTAVSLTVSYLDAAINGELYDRLFMVSVFVLLASQVGGGGSAAARHKILLGAVLAVTLLGTANRLLEEWTSTQIYSSALKGIQITHDPFWLIAVRRLLLRVPSNLGFGWLYVRYGIESSILASFIAAVAAHLFLIFVLIHFL
jgi:hypothetical protein